MCLVILMCTCVCKPHKDIRIITVVRKQTMKKYKAIEAANASSDEIKKLFSKTFSLGLHTIVKQKFFIQYKSMYEV